MSSQQNDPNASTQHRFEPSGFCPTCNYQMDAGKCPECGQLVQTGELLHAPLTSFQQTLNRVSKYRITIRLLILFVLFTVLVLFFYPHIVSSCVVQGSSIATPTGGQPIEKLKVGDSVTCQAPTGQRAVGTVVSICTARVDRFLEFHFDGYDASLCVTETHPVATAQNWRTASALKVGDQVVTQAGNRRVKAIRKLELSTQVFDISVEPHRNFFANGILVHNKSFRTPPNTEDLIGIWIGLTGDRTSFYRLDLRSDGTGLCTYELNGARTILYEITQWSLDGFSIDLELEPIDPDARAIYIRGSTTFNWLDVELDVEVGGIDDRSVQSMRLGREIQMLKKIESARSRMERFKAPAIEEE